MKPHSPSLPRRAALAALAALALPHARAWAQAYPTHAVRIVTPLSPGSGADIMARLLAHHMSETWGKPVTVENRPGGAGQVAGQILVSAPPDGYTLMVHSDGHAVSAALYAARLPYDTLRDMVRVSLLASSPTVLVVAPSLNVRSVRDLVALARSRPEGVTFGSAGVGGGLHLTGELFKQATGIQATHVPFRGPVEALTEVMAGRVDFVFAPLAPVGPLLRDGRLRALAVSSPQRAPVLPDLPTVAEAGYPGVDYQIWWGLFAPVGTPAPVIARLSQEVARVLALPDVRERLRAQSVTPRGTTPEEFDGFVRAEVQRLTQLARTAGIVPQ